MKNTCNGYNIRSRVQRHKITVIMKGHNIFEDLKMGKRTMILAHKVIFPMQIWLHWLSWLSAFLWVSCVWLVGAACLGFTKSYRKYKIKNLSWFCQKDNFLLISCRSPTKNIAMKSMSWRSAAQSYLDTFGDNQTAETGNFRGRIQKLQKRNVSPL